jgi:hypothetical protein
MQGFSSAFQQALIDIQCAVHLVSQKPGCVIERRFFFYSSKKLRVIRIHFPGVVKWCLEQIICRLIQSAGNTAWISYEKHVIIMEGKRTGAAGYEKKGDNQYE